MTSIEKSLGKRKLVYVMSPSFSGSTLLTLLLAQHPKLATIGELKATAMGPLDGYVCSCGDKIKDCKFWQTIISKSAEANRKFSLERFGTHFSSANPVFKKILGAQVRGLVFESLRKNLLKFTPGLHQEYQEILNQNYWLTNIICQLQDADICLDGSKDPHRLLYMQQSGLWDINLIWLHRDGIAQCNSRRHKERNSLGYEHAVREWSKTIRQETRISKLFPQEKVHQVLYEKLCLEPTEIMNQIFDFLKIEHLDIDWRDIDLKSTPHHILGNSMRTKERIQISLDNRWREQVSEKELEYFEKNAGALSRSLGY